MRAEAAGEVESSWERLHRAILRIAAERELSSVLSQITEQARALVGARYAILALPDDSGKPAHFVTSPSLQEAESNEIDCAAIALFHQQPDLFEAVLQRQRPLRTSLPLHRPEAPSLIMAVLGVPLCAGAEIIAALVLSDRAGKPAFSQTDIAILKGLADYAAVAIQAARRGERLALINQVGQHIVSIPDLDELLRQVIQLVRTAFGCYGVNIGLIEGDRLVFRAGLWGPTGVVGKPLSLRVGRQGITGWVAAAGQPLLVPDVLIEPRYYPVADLAETRAELAVPLCWQDQVVGVLDVQSRQPRAFGPDDLEVLKCLAPLIAGAVVNARLFEHIQRQERALAQRGVEVQQALATQSALVQEMGHRIRNSLQMAVGFLSYALVRHDASSLEESVHRAIDRIKGLAAVQEVLASTTAEQVGFHELTRRAVAVTMPEVLPGGSNPLLTFEGPDVVLPAEQAKSLALAVNELVVNAFRHGLEERHHGHILVLTEPGQGQVRVIVRDDGQGLPQGFDPRRDRGLGLTIARGLVERGLGGGLILSRSDHGTDAIIYLPRMEEQHEIATGAHR